MTITRALRYLVVSILLAIGGFAVILPTQAAEVAPDSEPVETTTGVTVEETTETEETPSVESEETDTAVTISEESTESAEETFFPEIDVVTSPDSVETVAYGGVRFVAGDTVTIKQEKAVDVFAAGESISLEEALTGDVFAAANTININAPVSGSVRVAGNIVTINAAVDRNVLVFANTVYIGSDAYITGHANIYASTVVMDGSIEQNFAAAAESVSINGVIMGTSDIEANYVAVGSGAWINEEGEIKSPQEPTIHASAVGADMLTYTYTNWEQREERLVQKTDWLLERAQKWTVSFFFFLIVGGLMILLWPKWTENVSMTMEKEFGQSAQKGLVYVFLVPIVLVAASVTILLIPFAFFVAPLYALSLVFARVFVGMLLGRHLVNKKFKEKNKQRLLEYMVGYFVVSILLSLPLIGWFFCMLAGAWGMGGVLQDWSNHRAANKTEKKTTKKTTKKPATKKKTTKK